MASPEIRPEHPPSAQDLSGSTVGRYQVLRHLGGGGMGEVYAAGDPALKRTVALKRLAPHLRADTQQMERMLKEAERASALNHPGIAAIYDVLQERGELFLVMEYVEGVSLRQRLGRGLAREELLDIVIQCADALEAAHARGILHGDVKPENIMVTHGRAKLLDFGVARRLRTAPDLTTATADTWGGTVGYMAPEALLQQDCDARSDLFALGVMLYEGISGVHPFSTSSVVLTIDRTLHHEPPSLGAVVSDAPPALVAIVDRLLAKDPSKRYTGAADVARDLRALQQGTAVVTTIAAPAPSRAAPRWALLALALIVTLAALALLALRVRQPVVPLPARKVIAVLPFRAAAAGGDEQAYADGISAGVSSRLAHLLQPDQAQIAAYSDVLKYDVTTAAQAQQALGASLAVDGSLLQTSAGLRVHYSLADAQSGHVFMAGDIDAPSSSSFSAEERITDAVLDALHLPHSPKAEASAAAPPSPAYADYLRGEGYLQRGTPAAVENAILSFSQALVHDSSFAPAYAGLGRADLRKFNTAHDPTLLDAAQQACSQAAALDSASAAGPLCLANVAIRHGRYQEAAALLQKAATLDPSGSDAYSQLGLVYLRLGRISQAEEYAIRATQVRPGVWSSHAWLGEFYIRIGQYGKAVEQEREAVRLAPGLAEPYFQLGGALLYAGENEEAVAALQRGLGMASDYRAWSNLGTAYLALRRFGEAVNSFEQAYRMAPGEFSAAGNLARAYYWSGRRNEAGAQYRAAIAAANAALRVDRKNYEASLMLAPYHAMLGETAEAVRWLARAQSLNPNDAESWFWAAIVRNQSGDRAGALSALEKALALGYSRSDVRAAPEFDNLRLDPRYQALVLAQ